MKSYMLGVKEGIAYDVEIRRTLQGRKSVDGH